jgi:hypothetical protein
VQKKIKISCSDPHPEGALTGLRFRAARFGSKLKSIAIGKSVLVNQGSVSYSLTMSVAEIKEKLAALSRREQDEVVAFLFHLRHAGDAEYQSILAQRLEDRDRSHWLTPAQFERELDKRERQ